MGSHAFFLQLQGADDPVVDALAAAKLEEAPVSDAERALLDLVRLVTQTAYRTTAEDIARVRAAGWTDEQIGEAVYVTAIFALFNRVADAFGLQDPGYRDMAPEQRPPGPATLPPRRD